MSTILPETAVRIGKRVNACGASFVDAPVAGTVAPAREGKLLVLAGGEPSDLARLDPVFQVLGRRTEHLGPVGSGSAMKLTHNALLATEWAVLAEALALGSRSGLDLKRMLDVIGQSPAAFAAIGVKMPMLLGQPGEIGFDLTNVLKDLRTIRTFAARMSVPMRVVDAAFENYESAVAQGFGSDDVARIVEIHREPPLP